MGKFTKPNLQLAVCSLRASNNAACSALVYYLSGIIVEKIGKLRDKWVIFLSINNIVGTGICHSRSGCCVVISLK